MNKSKEINDTYPNEEEPYISERDRIIDRTPAWIVAICSFLFISSHHGLANCGALFYPGLIETMDLPISVIAWSISGQFGISYLFAPLYNRLLDYVTTRLATVLAILFTLTGMVIGACSRNFIMFFMGYTVMAGIGMGIAMVRVIATMAEYFDFYRILALALCSSGAGFGTLIYSTVGRYFIEQYTWRVALIGFAIIHMHTIPLGLLIRPMKQDPISDPVFLDSGDGDQRRPSKVVTPFTSRLSMISNLGMGGQLPRIGSRMQVEPQDLGVVIEYVKIRGEKFELPEGLQPFWNITLEPLNFLTDPGTRLTEQLKTIASNYWQQSETLNDGQTMYTLHVPLIFLIPASESELEPQAIQDLMVDKLYSNPNLLVGSTLKFGPNDPKPKSCLMVGDSLTASIMNACDNKKSHMIVKQVVQKALTKVKQINQDLSDKCCQVSTNPILVILDQDDYFVRSKLTNYGTDERLCVLGYNAPDELTILEENEEQITPDLASEVQSNVFEANRNARRFSTSSSRYSKPRRISSSLGMSSTQLAKALARQYVEAQLQPDQLLQSSRSIGINLRHGSAIYRSCDIPIRPGRLSILAVDNPEEAVQLVISKFKAEEMGEEGDKELSETPKWYSNIPCLNPFYATLLISRTLIYMADSIVFSHLMNFSLAIGFSQQDATSLFSYIGISGMLARLGIGFLGQFAERIKIQAICAPSCLILGALTIVMPFIPSYGMLAAYGILYSTLSAPSFAFANAMVIEIMGTDRLDRNLSYLLLMEAFGAMTGAPLGGVFKEIRESFIDCFAFGGVCILLSGTIILVHGLVRMNCVQNKLEHLRSNSRKQTDLDSVLSATELPSVWQSKSSGLNHVTGF